MCLKKKKKITVSPHSEFESLFPAKASFDRAVPAECLKCIHNPPNWTMILATGSLSGEYELFACERPVHRGSRCMISSKGLQWGLRVYTNFWSRGIWSLTIGTQSLARHGHPPCCRGHAPLCLKRTAALTGATDSPCRNTMIRIRSFLWSLWKTDLSILLFLRIIKIVIEHTHTRNLSKYACC